MSEPIHVADLIERLNFLPEEPEFPHQDFEEALKVEKEITPILINELKGLVDNPHLFEIEIDSTLPLYAMVLLGKFRCKEAFPVILDVLSQDPEWVDDYFSFFLTQGLSNVLASTYNGNVDLLINFILNDDVQEWARIAGSSCLLTLTAHGQMSRETFHETYLQLLNNVDSGEFLTIYENLLEDSIRIYPEGELLEKIEHELNTLELDPRMELPEQLAEAKENGMLAQYRELREDKWQGFVDDIEEVLGWMSFYHVQEDSDDDENFFYEDDFYDSDVTSPIISYEEKVGRNDPCPCGSGKKYKKCCANL